MTEGVPPWQKLKVAFCTFFPLWCLVYLVVHAYEHDAVRDGRDVLLARLAQSAHFELELCALVLPLFVYAALFRAHPRGSLGTEFLRIARISGLVALGLLPVHLAQVWLPRRAALAPTAAYVGMLEATSTGPGVALVLLFVSASLVHLCLAVLPALDLLTRRPVWSRVLAASLGCGLWLWFVDILSAYGGGAALL